MGSTSFGLKIQPDYGFEEIMSMTRTAEELGYDNVMYSDHVQPPSNPKDGSEAWTTLAAMAALTKKIKLGHFVTCVSFRNPSLLATMASTVDVISKGRLTLGIGAGWVGSEYAAYGYPFPDQRTRVRQVKEALKVINVMWSQDSATFSGEFFSIKNAKCLPRPVQKPRPKILVGITYGLKTLPYMAVRLADGFNVGVRFIRVLPTPPPKLWLDVVREIAQSTRNYCERYQRRWDDLTRSIQAHVLIGSNASELDEAVDSMAKKFGIPTATLRSTAVERGLIMGEPHECAEQFRRYMEIGINDFSIIFHGGNLNRAMKTFRNEVVPQLR